MSRYLKYLTSYHLYAGTLAWLLMRLCGIVLAIYLIAHLGIIFWFGRDLNAFNRFLQLAGHPGSRIIETFLIWAVCYHAGNGIRLILLDLGLDIRWQRPLFVAIMILSFSLTIFLFI